MCCAGRRLRRVRPEKISKMNRVIQEINESITHCNQLLDSVERTVLPGDWSRGVNRMEDEYYNTWRTVGCFNLTDHFIARYLERIRGVRFDIDAISQFYSPISGVTQTMRLKYAIVNRTEFYLESSLCSEIDGVMNVVEFDPEFLTKHFSKTIKYNAKYHDFYVVMYLVDSCLLPAKCLNDIMIICEDSFDDHLVARMFGDPLQINLPEIDRYKVRYAYDHGMLGDRVKEDIREFIMNPPDSVRVVRKDNKVITVLS